MSHDGEPLLKPKQFGTKNNSYSTTKPVPEIISEASERRDKEFVSIVGIIAIALIIAIVVISKFF